MPGAKKSPALMYECMDCGYMGFRFRVKSHFLIQHVPLEEVPYRCLCGKRFLEKSSADGHLQIAHPNEMFRKQFEGTYLDNGLEEFRIRKADNQKKFPARPAEEGRRIEQLRQLFSKRYNDPEEESVCKRAREEIINFEFPDQPNQGENGTQAPLMEVDDIPEPDQHSKSADKLAGSPHATKQNPEVPKDRSLKKPMPPPKPWIISIQKLVRNKDQVSSAENITLTNPSRVSTLSPQPNTSKKTEAPKRSEVIKKPEVPKMLETPKKPEIPKKIEAPKNTEAPTKKPEAPKKSEVIKKLEVPKMLDTPRKPEIPKKIEAPKNTEAPTKNTEALRKAESPKDKEPPKKPEVPKIQNAPKKPEIPKKVEAPKNTEAPTKKPEASRKAETSKKLEATEKAESSKTEQFKKTETLKENKKKNTDHQPMRPAAKPTPEVDVQPGGSIDTPTVEALYSLCTAIGRLNSTQETIVRYLQRIAEAMESAPVPPIFPPAPSPRRDYRDYSPRREMRRERNGRWNDRH